METPRDAVPGIYSGTLTLRADGIEPTNFPVSLEIVLGTDELAVTGTSFPDDGDLPPCNGEGGPILEATGWTPAP